jgi:signal transduction histidine kinase
MSNETTVMSDATLVIVDDDQGSLRLSQQVLSGAGYSDIHLFTNVEQALAETSIDEVDLFITDLQMPDTDGMGLLRVVREATGPGEFLPILMITADSTTEARRRALAMGVDDFLTKPIDVVEMTLRVKHLLSLRTMHQQLEASKTELESEVERRTEQLNASLERLEELVRAKDMFIAGVSHELRTPLTAILGFARELADRPSWMSDVEKASSARLIADQASDLSGIIEDLLVAARSDINAVNVLREPVDLGIELRSVIEVLPQEDRARVRTVPVDTAVVADRLRVRQIIRNLLSNAIRHGGESISIEVEEWDDFATLTVVDDGVGVTQEVQDTIFEPYVRGSGDSGQPQSIGLGLAVSRFLARLMAGDLDLIPRPDGTAFRLSLPMVTCADPAPADTSASLLGSSFG